LHIFQALFLAEPPPLSISAGSSVGQFHFAVAKIPIWICLVTQTLEQLTPKTLNFYPYLHALHLFDDSVAGLVWNLHGHILVGMSFRAKCLGA
jgi:hypothetical protein